MLLGAEAGAQAEGQPGNALSTAILRMSVSISLVCVAENCLIIFRAVRRACGQRCLRAALQVRPGMQEAIFELAPGAVPPRLGNFPNDLGPKFCTAETRFAR